MTSWRGALAELLAVRGQALKRFAYLLCGDDAEADDLVQEALVKVLSRRATGEVRSLERYARPGPDAVAAHVAASDPDARRRAK